MRQEDISVLGVVTRVILGCCLIALGVSNIVLLNDQQNRDGTHLPRESFVLLRVSTTISLKECLGPKKKCKALVELPSPRDAKITHQGSGLIISNSVEASYILTAAHVCKNKMPDQIAIDDMSYSISTKRSVEIFDFHGNHHDASVLHADDIHDVCILRSDGVWGTPVRVAKEMPAQGEQVFNLAAPYGVYAPNMVLTFQGYYSGTDFFNNEIFTIPTRPGSSGSPIFNSKGELISVIHSSHRNFENIAIGCQLQNLKEIIDSYVSRKHVVR